MNFQNQKKSRKRISLKASQPSKSNISKTNHASNHSTNNTDSNSNTVSLLVNNNHTINNSESKVNSTSIENKSLNKLNTSLDSVKENGNINDNSLKLSTRIITRRRSRTPLTINGANKNEEPKVVTPRRRTRISTNSSSPVSEITLELHTNQNINKSNISIISNNSLKASQNFARVQEVVHDKNQKKNHSINENDDSMQLDNENGLESSSQIVVKPSNAHHEDPMEDTEELIFQNDSKSTRHIQLNRRVNRKHDDERRFQILAAKESSNHLSNSEPHEEDKNEQQSPNIKSEVGGNAKLVLIPSFRIVPDEELNSSEIGPTILEEKKITDDCIEHPGGIPLAYRVRFENQERYCHDMDRGSKSKRSTRLTYLDASCYDDNNSYDDTIELLSHHLLTDIRGNYQTQIEKVQSYQEYGRYEFCICHHDYENLPMIECENCENWFHMNCIDFDDGADGGNTDLFYCPNCLEYDSELEIVMKDGYVPRKLPYIRKPRKVTNGKKFYHIPTTNSKSNVSDEYESPQKNGKRKRKEISIPHKKSKKSRYSLPPNHENLWDPEATRIEDDFENDHFECDNYGNTCKKAFKKYKDAMLECNICHCTAHVFCPENQLTHLREEHKSIWCCDVCKSCWICQKGDKSDQGLLCDSCDRMYHMDCLTPPLRKKPKKNEMWYCPECISQGLERENHFEEDANSEDFEFVKASKKQKKNLENGNNSYNHHGHPGRGLQKRVKHLTDPEEEFSQCIVCDRVFSTTYSYARHLTTTLHKVRQKRWNLINAKNNQKSEPSRKRNSIYNTFEDLDSESGADDIEAIVPKRKYTRRK